MTIARPTLVVRPSASDLSLSHRVFQCGPDNHPCHLRGETALLAAAFPLVYLFRPAYIFRVEPGKEANFSYRRVRGFYPHFGCCSLTR
jgi:hypothetical protein